MVAAGIGGGAMNWRIGLIRVWTVGSASWAILVAWLAHHTRSISSAADACSAARVSNRALGNPFDCFDHISAIVNSTHSIFAHQIPLPRFIANYLAVVVGPILAALALGLVVAWVLAGFKHRTNGLWPFVGASNKTHLQLHGRSKRHAGHPHGPLHPSQAAIAEGPD
jgi:hypothetical protein